MLIYFDCEFTDLYDDVGPIKLISAGFVTFDSEEFYFELTDNYVKSDCSMFVEDEVLPHLNSAKHGMTSIAAAQSLKAWIEDLGFADLALASDAPQFDFTLVKDLLDRYDCWPYNLSKEGVDLKEVFKNVHIDSRVEEYFKYQPLAIRHHALWDARALAKACITTV